MPGTINDLPYARTAPTAPSPRYDALAQFKEPAPRTPIDLTGAARAFWAFCLLAAGIGVTVWLIVLIHALVFHPRTVGLLDRLASANPEDLALTLPAGKVQLPPAGMTVIGYLVLIVLTTIAARITAMMIRQGVSLLRRPDDKDKREPEEKLPPIHSPAEPV